MSRFVEPSAPRKFEIGHCASLADSEIYFQHNRHKKVAHSGHHVISRHSPRPRVRWLQRAGLPPPRRRHQGHRHPRPGLSRCHRYCCSGRGPQRARRTPAQARAARRRHCLARCRPGRRRGSGPACRCPCTCGRPRSSANGRRRRRGRRSSTAAATSSASCAERERESEREEGRGESGR